MDDQVCAPEDERQAGTPTIMHPPSGSHVGANVMLWGVSTPGSRVDILDGSEQLASADVDDMGFWGAPLHNVSEGVHDFRARAVVEEDDESRYSAPVRVVVETDPMRLHEAEEPVPPEEERRPAWPLLLAASILPGVVIVLAVLFFGRAHPGTSSAPAVSAPATSVPATSAPASPTALAAPAPAQTWSFARPAGSADQVVLTLNNPGAVRAVVTVRLPGSKQSVRLPPQGEAEMELGAKARNGSIRITSTAPIVAERIVVSKGKTSTSYGSHR